MLLSVFYTEKNPAGLKKQQACCLLKKILHLLPPCLGFFFVKDLKIEEDDRICLGIKPIS
jgi:hypothetical protein